MKKISILVPAYNEEKTLGEMMEKLQEIDIAGLQKEIIIINDGSKDNTEAEIKKLEKKYKNIISFHKKVNQGKGSALRTGIKYATGDIITIQDADLEYNPEDFKKLVQPILQGKVKVVYGSRMMGNRSGFLIRTYYYGNKLLTLFTRLLYRQKITDMETCYKVMDAQTIKQIPLESNQFDIEPEITAKLINRGNKILELPIEYKCRSFQEGKKIRGKDGIIAIYKLLKYKFRD